MDTHDKTQVETWIQDAKNEGISVHMFAQVFNDDEKWYNPTNQSFVDAKINELKEYAGLKDLAGIHLIMSDMRVRTLLKMTITLRRFQIL